MIKLMFLIQILKFSLAEIKLKRWVVRDESR